MTEKVEITAKFGSPAKNCRFSDQCRNEGLCEEAFALRQEVNYRLQNREGDALDYQLKNSTCKNSQAQEMRNAGQQLTSES